MIRSSLLVLFTGVLLAAEPTAATVPVAPDEFIIQAGTPATLRIRLAPGVSADWTLSDWDGRRHGAGVATVAADGIATIAVQAEAGWHELAIGGARFGLVVQEPMASAEPDPFFAIDAAMSWLVKEDDRRAVLISQMRRFGISHVRERLAWWALQTGPERFNGQTVYRDDALRSLYARQRIGVLDVFHDAPLWLGRASGVYPADLDYVATAWRTIVGRFPGATTAIEVWNEPDAAEFAADGTPDHLVALTRTVAWAARQTAPDTLICGGAFTYHSTERFRAACWANGLLGACDVFTYHDYAAPGKLEPHLSILRREMAAAGDPAIPVWITEAGKGWPSGSARPATGADVLSAQWITVRATEAKACGVQRYFAFVYPFYPEGRDNFGMTDHHGTALRSLAAYSHAARRLAGLDYAGDLDIAGCGRVRLFAGPGRAVAVAWFGDPGKANQLRTGLPVLACRGLDGRILPRGEDGAWTIDDGACFLDLDPGVRASATVDTAAMRLWRTAKQERARPATAPIVLQFMPKPGDVGSRLDHYSLVPQSGGRPNTMRVRITNCAPGLANVQVALQAPPGGTIRDEAERQVQVAGPGWIEVGWQVDAPVLGTWRIEAACAGMTLPPMAITTKREIDGEALLAKLPPERQRRITAEEMLAVDDNIGAGNRMKPSALSDGTWRLSVDFSKADRWAYPRLTLPADARFDRFDAVLIRAICRDPAAVRIVAFESGGANIGYISKDPIIAADGAWHWSLIRLADLERGGFSDPDPNGRLDPVLIERLSIGLNSQTRSNILDIGSLILIRLAGTELP